MSRDEQERLRDIKDAISAIRNHLANTGDTSAAKEDPLLRDLIAHEYFRIDIHRVLEVVERDLPPLEHTINPLLGTIETGSKFQRGP